MGNSIEYDIDLTVRLNKDRKLPATTPCPECFGNMKKRRLRAGVSYACSNCDSVTTLDPEDLKRLKLS